MSSIQSHWSASKLGVAPALEEVLTLADGSGSGSSSGSGSGGGGPAGSLLAADVETWVATPEQGLTASIDAVRGAGASADALAHLSPCSLEVVAAVTSDRGCWAEVIRRGGAEPETCLAGLAYDGRGAVSRLVWLGAPLVPAMPEVSEESAVPAARRFLEEYFADLMSSRFREAASHFTVDTIYAHPAYAGGTERVLLRGREALWRAFVTERGPSPARQIITDYWQYGGRVFVEGIIEGIPDGGTFFSTGQVTPEGEISRYVAFYSATRISSTIQPR